MSLRKFNDYFIPVLKVLESGELLHRRKIMEIVGEMEKLSKEELELQTDRGTNIFRSRVNWAQQFLYQAKAIIRPKTAHYQISDRGRTLLEKHPYGFTEKDLLDLFPDYADAWNSRKSKAVVDSCVEDESPIERLEEAILETEESVITQILNILQEAPPLHLEKLSLLLLSKMGYGIGEHTGGPFDGGIDGVIHQDKLGLNKIFVQTKRYKKGSNVGSSEISEFFGAVSKNGAAGGVFITTSTFTQEARKFADNTSPRIVLIDGHEFCQQLVHFKLGVEIVKTYELVKVHEDFFDELFEA